MSNIALVDPHIEVFVSAVIIKLFKAFPLQMAWHFLPTTDFELFNKRHNANKILVELKSSLQKSDGGKPLLKFIDSSVEFFKCLRRIAGKIKNLPLSESSISLKKEFPNFNFAKLLKSPILVPNSANMTVSLKSSHCSDSSDFHHQAFSNSPMIESVNDTAKIFFSKETPMRLTFIATDGHKHRFLLKIERRGDLRKDAKMNQLHSVVNRILHLHSKTRKKRVQIRTFFVAPLTEVCGLIEWVPRTSTFKSLCAELEPSYSLKACARLVGGKKNAESRDRAQMARNLEKLLAAQRPVFGEWFSLTFEKPERWLAARLSFLRSSAVNSMVGFIVGLGDRHGDNILVDTLSGEVVHVDFDCIFEKGRRLAVPEVVPFRLTQNVVAGFGLAGLNLFRIVCEDIMTILKSEKETLLSMLHSFVADPLLEHIEENSQFKGETGERVMRTVESKLEGCADADGIPLCVRGQVETLIKKASSFHSLSVMFFGWMPSI